MKKILLFSLISIFIVGALILLIFFTKPKEYLSIQNDKVFFGMSTNELIKIKGDPIEINSDIGDTPFDEYVFIEKLFGYNTRGSYSFNKSFFGLKLQSAYFVVDNLNYDDAKLCIDNVLHSFESFYSKKNNFYNNGLQSNDVSYIETSFGTNDGATGISCDMVYKDNSLIINIIKQD